MTEEGEGSWGSQASKGSRKQLSLEVSISRVSTGGATGVDLFERYLFPSVAEANRVRVVPGAVRLFEFIFISLQVFFGSWFQTYTAHVTDSGFRTFLKVLFIGQVGNVEDFLGCFIALMLIDLVTGAFLAVVVVSYAVNREHAQWTHSIFRFWHAHLFNLFAIPNMMMSVLAFSYLSNVGGAKGTAIAILSIPATMYSVFHYLTVTVLFSRSPYLWPSPVHCWRPKQIYFAVVISGLLFGLSGFFQGFEEWFQVVPRVLFIIFAITSFFTVVRYLPFKGAVVNAVCSAQLWASVVGSLLSIIYIYADLSSTILLIVPPVVFVVLGGIIWGIFEAQRKSIKTFLAYSSLSNGVTLPTEDERRTYLRDNLPVHGNARLALQWVTVGFEDEAELGIDWSLFKVLNEWFNLDADIVLLCAWIVSFFPSEVQFLHAYLACQAQLRDLSAVDRCMFFQLRRIHVFRQSSVTREATLDFDHIKRITDSTIASYCKFWSNIANPNMPFNRSSLFSLSVQRREAEAAWAEALEKYPNTCMCIEEYARFLVDC
jgi:hypothetical protein